MLRLNIDTPEKVLHRHLLREGVPCGGLLVPFRLFVISQRNNAKRKNEIMPCKKTQP